MAEMKLRNKFMTCQENILSDGLVRGSDLEATSGPERLRSRAWWRTHQNYFIDTSCREIIPHRRLRRCRCRSQSIESVPLALALIPYSSILPQWFGTQNLGALITFAVLSSEL